MRDRGGTLEKSYVLKKEAMDDLFGGLESLRRQNYAVLSAKELMRWILEEEVNTDLRRMMMAVACWCMRYPGWMHRVKVETLREYCLVDLAPYRRAAASGDRRNEACLLQRTAEIYVAAFDLDPYSRSSAR